MTKAELTESLANRLGVSRAEADRMINAFTGIVTESLTRGEDVALTGFGAFSVSNRAARMGFNPQTGEKIQIAATKSPKFKAGKALKDAVKGS